MGINLLLGKVLNHKHVIDFILEFILNHLNNMSILKEITFHSRSRDSIKTMKEEIVNKRDIIVFSLPPYEF